MKPNLTNLKNRLGISKPSTSSHPDLSDLKRRLGVGVPQEVQEELDAMCPSDPVLVVEDHLGKEHRLKGHVIKIGKKESCTLRSSDSQVGDLDAMIKVGDNNELILLAIAPNVKVNGVEVSTKDLSPGDIVTIAGLPLIIRGLE